MRVAFDMTEAMTAEADKILAATDLATYPDLFRRAFTLLRIHVDATRDGKEIVRQEIGSDVRDIIMLPFTVTPRPANGGE